MFEDVKHFCLEVIGLTEGFRPEVPIHGYWLNLPDLPVLHLMGWNVIAETSKYDKGHIDHIAFSCDGLEEFINKLKGLNVLYSPLDFNLDGGVLPG